MRFRSQLITAVRSHGRSALAKAQRQVHARAARVLAALVPAVFAAGCAVAPSQPPPAPAPAPSTVYAPRPAGPDVLGAIAYATSLRGTPYVYGGDSPDKGFDCSGFVQHVYGQLGVRLPRRAEDMARALPSVALEQRTAGDLVLFNTDGRAHSHVGIYLGADEFVHAPSSRTGAVTVSNLRSEYWRRRIDGVRRPHPPTGF